MYSQQERRVTCPSCGEPITLLVDSSEREQSYVEDCSVCCRPMVVNVTVYDSDDIAVAVWPENP